MKLMIIINVKDELNLIITKLYTTKKNTQKENKEETCVQSYHCTIIFVLVLTNLW
jgi:hypothetical protein